VFLPYFLREPEDKASIEDVTKMGAIGAGLRRRGFPEADLAKIARLNFLRVWDAVASRAG
jgi:microsomal dipeptidase-like Zn-dependent dipeptidase